MQLIVVLLLQENTPAAPKKQNIQDGPAMDVVAESDMKVTVEKELVSQAEEEDMEALLSVYVYYVPFFAPNIISYL